MFIKISKWKEWAKIIKSELYTLYYAYKDPRLGWIAKIFIILVIAYAFSPIDLIPDFIPILGYIDDLILLPIGIIIAKKMIPGEVLTEAKKKANDQKEKPKKNWFGAVIIILFWLIMIKLLFNFFKMRYNI